MDIRKPVQFIKGIGPKTSMLFNRIDVFSIYDLLTHFPRVYEDRRFVRPIGSLKEGDMASVIGEVCLIDKGRYTKSGRHMAKVVIKNETGMISGVWFNQKYIISNFKIGDKVLFFGKVSLSFNEKQIINPEFEKVDEEISNCITPIYPSTKNLSQKTIRNAVLKVLNSGDIGFDETLPERVLSEYGLCTREEAIRNIHFPEDNVHLDKALYRLKFEELLELQLGLMMERDRVCKNNGISFKISDELKGFVSSLPFILTRAQKKAVNEILSDMKSSKQMNRLVQGDVGSGKTIVAVIALFNAVKNGYQGAMMAPTEILASQHYESLKSLYKGFNINVEYLSGKISKQQKDEIKERLRCGDIDIIIGTHAVIQEDVDFMNLGLVITDEQHRFGVRQRAKLSAKGMNPDILIMTATPIPRTMALFIYGDLDISLIDELPPGRQKVDTYAVRPGARGRIYNFVRSQIKNGRQAYIVCPLIEESDVLDAESAVETAEKLKREYLKGISVGLLHGRMKPDEKDEIMNRFKNKEIDVLVSTTVIEVGINVPNATIMVVENADRFGLAQLHQLRGRVGRGSEKSYCILVSSMETNEAINRMKIMQELSDGFKIAEKDMESRGTGEFFGTRQHGLPELKLADIFADAKILKITNELSKKLVSSGAIYTKELEKLKKEVENKFDQKKEQVALN